MDKFFKAFFNSKRYWSLFHTIFEFFVFNVVICYDSHIIAISGGIQEFQENLLETFSGKPLGDLLEILLDT